MKTFSFETNNTLGDYGTDNEDFFAGVYSDKIAVVSMVIMYFIGLVGIMGIVFIIWIERSGQAGPYRTLINQLVSHNYQTVSNFLMQMNKIHIYILLQQIVTNVSLIVYTILLYWKHP